MKGACQTPSSSCMCGGVGGALRRRSKRVSVVCGAIIGAAAATSAASATNVNPARRLFTRTGIHQREREVGEERAERKEDRARSCAAGDEVHVARAQRVEHQASKTRPGGNHFD